jgi:TRAP-type C4-dicarboxylate transport system permease large subunit
MITRLGRNAGRCFTLAIILPPSIPMILYGVMAETSIVQLFVAGIVPGLLGGLGMMLLCYYLARRHGWPVEQWKTASSTHRLPFPARAPR